MSKTDLAKTGQSTRAEGLPTDDPHSLYVGSIHGWATVLVHDNELDQDQQRPAQLWGEMVLRGSVVEGVLLVTRLHRLALYGALLDPSEDDPIGVLCLNGPVSPVELSPAPGDLLQGARLALRLHYAALSEKLPPRYVSGDEDAFFPEVETIEASIAFQQPGMAYEPFLSSSVFASSGGTTWENLEGNLGPANELAANLVITGLSAAKLVRSRLGLVKAVVLHPPVLIQVRRAGSQEPRPAPHRSLSSHCEKPAESNGCQGQLLDVERWIPVKFINLSTAPDIADLCQQQMNGFCEVWRNKAALDLTVWPNDNLGAVTAAQIAEVDSTLVAAFRDLDRTQEASLPSRIKAASLHHAEVYLVDQLLDRPGGGVSHECDQPSAFCILAVAAARQNPYLLAHELGHIIGLSHPGEPPCSGSAKSVLEPGSPNLSINTLFNCRIFRQVVEPPHDGGSGSLLNSIVHTTAIHGCFRPDRDE